MVLSRAASSSETRIALILVIISIAFVLVAMSPRPAEASGDRTIVPGASAMSRDTGQRFSVKLVALRGSDDVAGVGQPGSWFDRRTDRVLKRWWKRSWAVYPAAVGTGWGLALSFHF